LGDTGDYSAPIVSPSVFFASGGRAMPNMKTFAFDKGFNILVGAPLGVAITTLYSQLFGFFSWQAILAGVLVFISAFSAIQFFKYERRSNKSLDDEQTLLGTWSIKSKKGHYVGFWKFYGHGRITNTFYKCDDHANGTFSSYTVEGRWDLTKRTVRITWPEVPNSWETLQRPIDPAGMIGDSWIPNGTEIWEVRKLYGS
jgi:hypothetical protein